LLAPGVEKAVDVGDREFAWGAVPDPLSEVPQIVAVSPFRRIGVPYTPPVGRKAGEKLINII